MSFANVVYDGLMTASGKLRHFFVFFFLLFSFRGVFANVLGDMQTFAPNTDGMDFVTVHSGRTIPQGSWAFSNYVNYAYSHLLVYSNLATQDKLSPYRDQLIEYDLDIAYGITDRFEVFFATPILLWQKPDENQPIAVNVARGSATYRPGVKWTLSDDSDGDSSLVGSFETLTVVDSPYVGVSPQPIINLEYAKTWKNRTSQRYHGLNLGYRLRNPTEAPASARMFPIDDQVIASYGYSAPFTKTSRWVFETFVSFPVDKKPYKRSLDASSVDLLLGLKHRWFHNLNFDWGATIEPPGLESLAPAFRLFAGLVYYWKPGGGNESVAEPPPPPIAAISPTAEPLPAQPLKITPETAEVWDGATLNYAAVGGTPPYQFSIEKGPARIQASGLMRAMGPGEAIVKVKDIEGVTAEARLVIRSIPKPDREIVLKNLHFKFDTDELTAKSEKMLARQIPTLRQLKINRLIVVGHTDSIGNDEYNRDLSEKRAKAIRRNLIKALDLPGDAVDAIGRGESQPIATNKTDSGRLANRRVDLKIYYRK